MRALTASLAVLMLFTVGFAAGNAQAQNLPSCPGTYSPQWNNCVGTYTYADGSKYVGAFRDGDFNGQGTLTWGDGAKYVGEFKDNLFDGQGIMTYLNGEKYVGEFRDDLFDGQGIMTYPNGEKYVGEFRDDLFDGQGTYTWADGEKYVGEYRADLFDGQGTYTWGDGAKYVGEFKDDLFDGQGTMTYPNGEKYVGEFKDDMFNGQGTLYASDGTVLEEGFWNDDELVPGDLGDGMAALSEDKCQEALRLLLPLAEQRNADAQSLMGDIYDDGECVPEDNAQAVRWYRLAAKQGNEDAQYIVESYDKFEISGDTLVYIVFDDDSIEWTDAAWLEDILLSNPNLTTMKLTSDGGEVGAGYAMANTIIHFELNTHVIDKCLSACTILFLAGERRTIQRGSILGFHQSWWAYEDARTYYENEKHNQGWADEIEFAVWMHEDTQDNVIRDMRYFLERGVTPEFAINSIQAASDDMWYPTRRELVEANVIRE